MKIAFVVTEFPALSETFVLNQVTGLIDRGHEVHVIAHQARNEGGRHPDIDSYGLMEKVRYYAAPRSYLRRFGGAIRLVLSTQFRNWPAMLKTLNILRFGRKSASLRLLYYAFACNGGSYDFLLCHSGPNGHLACQLREAGLLSGKIVTFFHGYDISSYLRDKGENIYRQLFEFGDMFLPISDFWKQRLVGIGCPPGKIEIHRMGVDRRRFVFRPRFWNGQDQLQLVSVARLVEKKGIEYGIRAVARLEMERRPVSYTIIGDGALRADLQELIDELAIGHCVRMVGSKNQLEVRDILARSHVLLAPSVTSADGDQEGIPVAIMEAMATGLLVVSTDHSGIPELVTDGVTGLLVSERDYHGIAEKISNLFADPDLLMSLSRAGYEKVTALHDIDRLNDDLVSFLSGK